VGEAATVGDGLILIRETKPDVAIIDLGLPDGSGIDLTRRIQTENHSLNSPKIIILTLQDSEEQIIAAFAAGANSYCIKNINFDKLFEAINETNRGNSWIDPSIARIVLSRIKTSDSHAKKVKSNDNYGLTDRELEVLQSIVDGNSNDAIAKKLNISVGTVKTHVCNILNKLAVNDRTQAAVAAIRMELVS
ncbi:MAG: LuxR C-terminal-related transcriptional regulator, partial [Waterburya sp.]